MIGDNGRDNKGFTVVEMLMALGIFSVAIVVLVSSFLSANRAARLAAYKQAALSDLQTTLLTIEQLAREMPIDYAAYGQVTIPAGSLRLLDEHGQSVYVTASSTVGAACATPRSTPCLVISRDGGTTFSPLTSERSRLVLSGFYISPLSDPATENRQPLVTMVLGVMVNSADGHSLQPIYVQRTVSSRSYVK